MPAMTFAEWVDACMNAWCEEENIDRSSLACVSLWDDHEFNARPRYPFEFPKLEES